MLIDVVKQDTFLTWSLIVVGILWVVVFVRNMWQVNKKAAEFENFYDHILNADEYKVKGKYDH